MSFHSAVPQFLHLSKKKYREQRKELKKFFKEDSFRIDPNVKISDRSIIKYWIHRRYLFRLIDDGNIYLTQELWYSVTPELVAKFTAEFLRACLPNATTVIDMFCGAGGNTIQFASLFPKVYAVDIKMEHLYCTYKNAQAYGLENKIWLKYADWTKAAQKGQFENIPVDCIFASAPWGGPQYLYLPTYDLEKNLRPLPLSELLKTFFKITSNVVLFLPRNSDLSQLSQITLDLLGPEKKCKVLQLKHNGHLKGLLCLWGESFYNYETEDSKPNSKDASSTGTTDINATTQLTSGYLGYEQKVATRFKQFQDLYD
ncbi:RNA methyltransferase Ecym_2393 [Eremothecium cymbalariae DBVPG|uniref:Trimethylguanosine synthase n=1 Tax=Eremothecium cymbalariae (strain CBS 270.75 / DBVPG 7215 / KCTC 17166 / NRRL Y-17582) TaxID=931890 RepID=G8JNQ8_ERECY|nr:Hypothetical protein Ecym_2393 [Eremothecium cymbalariae DBVPG\